MTKAGIVQTIQANTEYSQKEAVQLLDTFFEILKDTLLQGESVKASGFGSFTTRHKHARKGRNPQSGETIIIKAHRVITFKPSPQLVQAINQ